MIKYLGYYLGFISCHILRWINSLSRPKGKSLIASTTAIYLLPLFWTEAKSNLSIQSSVYALSLFVPDGCFKLRTWSGLWCILGGAPNLPTPSQRAAWVRMGQDGQLSDGAAIPHLRKKHLTNHFVPTVVQGSSIDASCRQTSECSNSVFANSVLLLSSFKWKEETQKLNLHSPMWEWAWEPNKIFFTKFKTSSSELVENAKDTNKYRSRSMPV